MPIVHESSTFFSSSGAPTVILNKPTGTVEGSTLVAAIHLSGTIAGDSFSAPDGTWTKLYEAAGSNVTALFYKVAGNSEPASYTFTCSGASVGQRRGVMSRLGGAHATSPNGGVSTSGAGTSTSPVGNSLVTPEDGCMLILFTYWFSAGTHTAPASMTEAVEISRHAVSTEIIAAAGATGTRTAALSASAAWRAVMWAVRPAAADEPDPEPEPEVDMAHRFGAEIVHFSAARRLDTEDVYVSETRRLDTDEIHTVATRRFSAKEVFANAVRRPGTRKVYISGSGA